MVDFFWSFQSFSALMMAFSGVQAGFTSLFQVAFG